MKITRLHADFWTLKRAPAFIRSILEVPEENKNKSYARQPFDINCLIPDEPLPRKQADSQREMHNTIVLLKSYRRQGKDLYKELRKLAASPHSTKERKTHCSRWWRKIYANRKKSLDIVKPV